MCQPCPCHLAETGDCILCSQLQKCKCCECSNWKGVCIYNEFIWNGMKAKEGRGYCLCKILNKVNIEDSIIILTLEAPRYLVESLVEPGSFVFIRHPKTEVCFDAPIAIMDTDTKNQTIKIAIELKGVKTKKIDELIIHDDLLVKGPYWNGVLGLRHIKKCKNSTCVLVARGIGQAPIVHVLKELYNNGNKLITIIDNSRLNDTYIEEYLDKYNCKVYNCNTFEKGDVTLEFKELLMDILIKENVSLVHCDGADILNYKVMKLVEAISKGLIDQNLIKNQSNFIENAEDTRSLESIKTSMPIGYSCCNNAKMCCGEGVCGCCTRKNNDHKLRRLCKMQTDPKYVFEGRRLF